MCLHRTPYALLKSQMRNCTFSADVRVGMSAIRTLLRSSNLNFGPVVLEKRGFSVSSWITVHCVGKLPKTRLSALLPVCR
jgi:hypothetical protein